MNTQEQSVCTPSGCETPPVTQRTPRVARPEYQVERRDDGLHLHLALPGVTREQITLSVENDLLHVTAERPAPAVADWKVHLAPDLPDRYDLRVRLHRDLDPASVNASLADGILTLAVERHEASKPRTIAVN